MLNFHETSSRFRIQRCKSRLSSGHIGPSLIFFSGQSAMRNRYVVSFNQRGRFNILLRCTTSEMYMRWLLLHSCEGCRDRRRMHCSSGRVRRTTSLRVRGRGAKSSPRQVESTTPWTDVTFRLMVAYHELCLSNATTWGPSTWWLLGESPWVA